MSKVIILREACKGVEDCGICVFVCPRQVLVQSKEMNQKGYMLPKVKDEALCTDCQNCMIYCPDFAIVVEKDPLKPSPKMEVKDE